MQAQTTFSLASQQGSLKRVEILTSDEKVELQRAADVVTKAQAELGAAQAKVAAAHKMSRESYMEWSSWYEFDGDFILQRFVSTQSSFNSLTK